MSHLVHARGCGESESQKVSRFCFSMYEKIEAVSLVSGTNELDKRRALRARPAGHRRGHAHLASLVLARQGIRVRVGLEWMRN